MDVLSYNIVIKTPIGYRVGNISLDIIENRISGTIVAPFFSPDFSGILNDDGSLSLSLTVNDEKGQYEYMATGRISAYAIHISVPVQEFSYEIDGTAQRNR